MTLFISIAVALAVGLFMTRVTNLFKMPDVTAFLIAGIIIGPFCLGRIGLPGLGFVTYESIEQLNPLSELALGFIAFAIGTEFMLPKLKKIGKQAVAIGIVQAIVAVAFVTIALTVLHFIAPEIIDLPTAVVLGAIASATAPAATLMVVRQFKAKGPVTDILLPVVALDDAVGLVCFAIAMGVAKALMGGAVDVISIVVNPLVEIILSLVLGAVLGFLLANGERFFHSNRNRVILIVGGVILTVALAMINFSIGPIHVGFSSLLVCMMAGTIFCNLCPLAEELMDKADKWTGPLYCLFFVLSGAELRIESLLNWSVILIGVIYIIFRSAGKYFGARWSASATKCEPMVTKYLGITLLPQAGVALGMSLTASEILGSTGTIIRTITLFGVLIYELVGPSLTKMALTKAGEIQPKGEDVKNRRQRKLEGKN